MVTVCSFSYPPNKHSKQKFPQGPFTSYDSRGVIKLSVGVEVNMGSSYSKNYTYVLVFVACLACLVSAKSHCLIRMHDHATEKSLTSITHLYI